jgi:hypothetical protein
MTDSGYWKFSNPDQRGNITFYEWKKILLYDPKDNEKDKAWLSP